MTLNVWKGCGLMRSAHAALPGEQSIRTELSTQPGPFHQRHGCTTLGSCPAGLGRRSPQDVLPRVSRVPPIQDMRRLNRRPSSNCSTWRGGKVVIGEASGPGARRAHRPRLAIVNRLVWTLGKAGTMSLLAPTGARATDRAATPSGRQPS